ncbi:multivesicular body subunit 12A [Callorhinchus milii]|uniref:multivesicular body subunit 12A n=1 Tax=Callorhinchus milii TaxID=7868 RepID=UPI001C3FE718|nr:multivesicular body subunit 12A [Callorhinchus milii]XP_042200593.1 multivesicular body subunit 12A [Callorhinchus milii]
MAECDCTDALTGVAWTSSQNSCPKEYKIITTTADGSSANFTKGFGKSGCFLCVSALILKENPQGDIVSEIQLLPDKSPLPLGYSFINEFLDSKVTVSKKKRLCVKRVPFSEADTAVFDIKLTVKSKQIVPSYTCIGELNGFIIWCKKGQLSRPKPKPSPKTRAINKEMSELSLERETLGVFNQVRHGAPQPRLGKRRSTLEAKDTIYNSENIYGISAMDGVPFVLHPRYEKPLTVVPCAFVGSVQIMSQTDIESKYGYSFVTEKSAATRPPPTPS